MDNNLDYEIVESRNYLKPTTSSITTSVIDTKKIVKEYKGTTIYFILHALTLITAFTWHQLIQDYIGTFKKYHALKCHLCLHYLLHL